MGLRIHLGSNKWETFWKWVSERLASNSLLHFSYADFLIYNIQYAIFVCIITVAKFSLFSQFVFYLSFLTGKHPDKSKKLGKCLMESLKLVLLIGMC